jgi:hypothetical protein
MNISTIQVHEHKYNTSTWTLQNTAENRKYRRKQNEYTARKKNRAFMPIVGRV